MTYWPFFVLLIIGTVYGAGVAIKEDTKTFFSCMKYSFMVVGFGLGLLMYEEPSATFGMYLVLTTVGSIILGGIFYIFSLGLRS